MTVPPNHEVEPNNKIIINYWLIMIFVFLKMSFEAFVLHVFLYLYLEYLQPRLLYFIRFV